MKAWVLNKVGEIKFEEVDRPVPKEGEVLLRVRAAGICGSDIPRVYQTGAHKMPLIPGHEFSGIVTAVGPEVTKFKPGDRVVHPAFGGGIIIGIDEDRKAYEIQFDDMPTTRMLAMKAALSPGA